jgi:nuclear transport factor 2 (NTF2) superfamily protein
MTQDTSKTAGKVSVCLMPQEIKAWLQEIVDAFHQQDLERLAADWTEDIVIRFADLPEIRGKEAAKAWLKARFARQKNYRLEKSFQAVTGNLIGDSWTGRWLDGTTGKKMQGRGMEFLTMREGRIALWEAVFNAWEEGSDPKTPVV